jgi:predicted ferric reductase
VTWVLIRVAGFTAYVFLSGAAIWGLIVSTGLLGRAASTKNLTYIHESLSISALLATAAHIFFLYLDDYIEFTPKELFTPGASDWKPVAVSMGILSLYGLALITASFYVRKLIGQKTWRWLHFLTFGVFSSAVIHGLIAGTDTGTPLGVAIYAATISVVVGLIVVRIILIKGKAARSPRQAAPEAVPAAERPVAMGEVRPFRRDLPSATGRLVSHIGAERPGRELPQDPG